MQSRAPTSPFIRVTGLVAVTLLGASCTGTVSDTPGGSGPGGPNVTGVPGNPPAPGSAPAVTAGLPPSARTGACKSIDPGPSPVRLLTRVEYDNTVRDLLGDMARGVAGDL